MRRAALLGLLVLAGCGGGAASGPAADAGKLAVERVDLTPGAMAIVVSNGTGRPAQLCQVAVDSGFVPYDGPELTVAPHTTGRLVVPYPWIAGQRYAVKVLTGDGESLEYQVAPS